MAKPTCQWLLLSQVPDGDSLPHAAGQDTICRGVELQHIHCPPTRPEGQPRAAGHVLATLRQTPHLHLQPQGEVIRPQTGKLDPAGCHLGLLFLQALIPEGTK